MESECTSPRLQQPNTCPYLESHQSSPCPPPHFHRIQFNIILPSTPGSSKWSLSPWFPHQNPVYISALSHMCHMPRPSHSSRFDHPNNIWQAVQIKAPHYVVFSTPLWGPNTLLSTLFSNTLSLRLSLNVNDQVSHPSKTSKIIVLYIMFIFLNNKLENKIFCTEW